MTENTAPSASAPLTPAVLSNQRYGLYSWSNGADPLSAGWLSANIYREQGGRREWVVKFFAGRILEPVHTEEGLCTLYQVRRFLPLVAADYVVLSRGMSQTWTAFHNLLRVLSRDAWTLSSELEMEHLGLGPCSDSSRQLRARALARWNGET